MVVNALAPYYYDVIMGAMASKITSLTIVYSIAHSGADQRKGQSSASLAFVRGIHRWPVNSPHKWSVTRKFFPFDDVIMKYAPDCIQPPCSRLWLRCDVNNFARYISHYCLLTHWGRDKMAAAFQTTFSIQLRFHRTLFLRVQLTIFQLWFR